MSSSPEDTARLTTALSGLRSDDLARVHRFADLLTAVPREAAERAWAMIDAIPNDTDRREVSDRIDSAIRYLEGARFH